MNYKIISSPNRFKIHSHIMKNKILFMGFSHTKNCVNAERVGVPVAMRWKHTHRAHTVQYPAEVSDVFENSTVTLLGMTTQF